VITKIHGSDPILRPSMTTGNQIITQTFSDVIHIPLETVFATADSVPFVYRKDGSRQVVVLRRSTAATASGSARSATARSTA